jgi:ADP-ribose pyrophosphatase YjhB (NUDIX family)
MCISVFAVLRKGGGVLVGVNKRGGRWASEWLPSITKSTGKDLDEEWATWRLPSAYIFEGEHPDDALVRIVRGQLGVSRFAYSSPRVSSYAEPSEWYPGNRHWDLTFAYEVTTTQAPRKHPHWKELLFLDASELRKRNFGWNNDYVREMTASKPLSGRSRYPPKT